MVNELKKKKILVVFHSEEKNSGATRSMLQIVTYLQQTGKYEIEAVFPKPDGCRLSRNNRHKVSSLYLWQVNAKLITAVIETHDQISFHVY